MTHRATGFTLVETLVAITLLTFAILAPFDAIQHVISASRVSKDQIIASALAQETLEYVRFIRTSDYLEAYRNGTTDTYDPMAGLDGTSNRFGSSDCQSAHSKSCTVDATVGYGSAIGPGADAGPLYLNADGSYTETNTGTSSGFTRTFTIAKHSGYETITVTVTWNDHGAQTLTLSEDLYDWL